MKTRKYFLQTLGCSKNEVDSEAIEVDLISAGLQAADNADQADLLILNSCGFILDAKIESIDAVLSMHKSKKNGSVLVMCGCLPARYDMQKDISEVDLFLASTEHYKLVPYLKNIGWEVKQDFCQQPVKRIISEGSFAYLKISEGCNNRCAYCAIPDIKGNYISRNLDDILREAKYLSDQSIKELVVIAQDTTMYGRDLGDDLDLGFLLGKLNDMPNIEWIRLMYAHPAHIGDSTITALAEFDKLLSYIDLPLQHINDRMLKLMNRKIDRNGIERLLEKLRDKIPNLVLRTSLIAGFPGETDKEFEELMDFCDTVKFENLGIFKYSPEDGTPAEKMPDRLDEKTVDERYHALLDLQNSVSEAKLGKKIGQTERILIDEVNEDGRLTGRAWFQAPEVDGQVIVENTVACKGEFLNVEFISADAYDIYARTLKQE